MEKKKTDDIKQWYRRKKWNDVKQVVIERDGGRCQECKKMITGRFIIHHKIPSNKENFYDLDNLELVCQDCHNRLTFHDDINKNHRQVSLLSGSDDLIPFQYNQCKFFTLPETLLYQRLNAVNKILV